MIKYVCTVCGFTYNEETAEVDHAGNKLKFKDIRPDWKCPNCGVSPDLFKKENSNERKNNGKE